MPTIKEGDRFLTSGGTYLTVSKYNNCSNIDVVFDDTGYTTTAQASHIRRGLVKDRLQPSVHGVGFLGIGKHKSWDNGAITKAASLWKSMLSRCYDPLYLANMPTYVGTSTTAEWHDFQSFAEWFYDNYVDGWELDKDYLGMGRMMYSPDTCCFMPSELNSLLRTPKSKHAIGVDRRRNGRYRAKITSKDQRSSLGTYDTEMEAHAAWKKAKVDQIYDIMANHKLDQRLTDRLHDVIEELESDKEFAGL